MRRIELRLALDVGSTTVKAVAVEPGENRILWKHCERHATRPLEKVLEFLQRLEQDFPEIPPEHIRVSATGSGGQFLVDLLGAKFVQEVTAVCAAVERPAWTSHPSGRSRRRVSIIARARFRSVPTGRVRASKRGRSGREPPAA